MKAVVDVAIPLFTFLLLTSVGLDLTTGDFTLFDASLDLFEMGNETGDWLGRQGFVRLRRQHSCDLAERQFLSAHLACFLPKEVAGCAMDGGQEAMLGALDETSYGPGR